MKNKHKILLDTSVLISALNSPTGASGYILSLGMGKYLNIILSYEVMEEAREVIDVKFPHLKTQLTNTFLMIRSVSDPVDKENLKTAYKMLETEDTPILASALAAKCDVLITLDKRFMKLAQVSLAGKTPLVMLPSEYIHTYVSQPSS